MESRVSFNIWKKQKKIVNISGLRSHGILFAMKMATNIHAR